MIDFSKCTLQELRAIGSVMDDLMREDAKLESWKFAAYVRSTAREAFRAESVAIAQQARDAAEPAGDPPAPPDMFGWVGDALDDLCAAGEATGNDR